MSSPNRQGNTTLRIALAEDSVILREGLTALLERRGHAVVVAVGDSAALLQEVHAAENAGAPPDIVIADVRMPPTHSNEGLTAALTLRQRYPGLPVLLFSQHVEPHYATRLLADDRGAIGYLLKDRIADVSDFLDSVHRISAGQTVLDPDVVRQVLRTATSPATHTDGLTQREHDVLTLMAEGHSNTAIAGTLHISYGAVEKHVTGIFTKLHLDTDPHSHRRVRAVLHHLRTHSI